MKKNDWLLLISVALYSALFYEQSPGTNFLLFNLALVVFLLIRDNSLLKSKNWIFTAIGAIVSSVGIMLYSSPLAIIANILSLSILSTISIAPKTSVFTSLFMSLCSMGSSCVFMFIDWARRRKKDESEEKVSRPFHVKLLMFVFIIVVTIIFFLLYQTSNPLFKDFTKNINLDFISWGWIFFTLGGFLLLYGFFYNRRLGGLTDLDENATNELSQEKAFKSGFLNNLFKIDTEYLTGLILFVTLNLLLLLLNVLDLRYLWFDGTLPEGMNHKQFVHEGVGALITSIICAIIIILYYFRGRLNYHEKNKHLKLFAYIWIAQNAFMIFSTAWRNNMYISDFGISYKKIGLYVYLLLTLIGLIATYIKIYKTKSNWYLIRNVPWAFFFILIGSSIVNWDTYITNFNINKALNENKNLEKYYLVDLSFKNLPQLLQLSDSIKENDDYEIRDYYYSSRGTYFYSFKTALDNKLYTFLKQNENLQWPSYCSEKSRVLEEIKALNNSGKIKSLELSQNNFISSLSPLKELTNVESLNLDNTYFKKIEELSYFPHLKKLSLRSDQIDSLEKMPELKELVELNLGSNTNYDREAGPGLNAISGLSALSKLKNLETLDLSSSSLKELEELPDLKKLKSLDISGNYMSDFTALKKYNSLQTLSLRSTFVNSPDRFPALTSVTNLDLSNNQIIPVKCIDFFEKLRACKNITNINFSSNQFENIYYFTEAFWRSRYYSLGASKDSITTLLPRLEVLNLSSNLITSVSGIEEYKDLKEFNLYGNKLKNLESIWQLKNLKALYLSSNPIETLHNVDRLTSLETLNLSDCGIKTGFASISFLKNLLSLNVSGNNIADITPFVSITSLKDLDLSNNHIKELKGIEKLTNLETLNLKRNKIKDFSALHGLKKLKIVYIDYIEPAEFLKLKKALPNCRVYDLYRGN